ncbi:MAG TPA: hypothetical protein VHT52_19375 [Stellaceae bacterium]|jgi:hypothetical protein|nr:hypothetical protein [Stellaceae bacterium]
MSIGGSQSKGGYDVTGGGTNAPWNWGVSDFDQSQINAATGSNEQAVTNRYNQLGLGGSTMEGQDVAGAGQMGEALTGQEQTANVGTAALNPALQPQLNSLIGAQSNPGVSLGSLAGAAGKLAAL